MRLAADANVLLSAVLGGRARRILEHSSTPEIFTTEATLAEVQEYAGKLANEKGLPLDLVLMTVATLPVTVIGRPDYEAALSEAKRRIGRRDPDDIEILALALHFDLPVWSNDNDFENTGVVWYTTAELLAKLRL